MPVSDSVMAMHDRIDRIRPLLAEHDADAALLTFLPDIRWACGFSGSNGVLLVQPDRADFFSDGRYDAQARRQVTGATVHIPGYQIVQHLAEEGFLDGVGRLAYQADHVTVAQLHEWQDRFPEVDWVEAPQLLQRLVGSKDEAEVARIERAQAVTDAVFEELLAFIQPGMTEQDIAAEIVYQHLKRGAEKMSFEPIVASGPNSALPHARPSDKIIETGEMVVLDFGCFLDGYASDMTRTIAVGEPGDEARQVYALVLEAQRAALEAAHAGMSSKALDGVARDHIDAGGYGDYFSHGLGHGVGLQIHEWPRLSYHVDDELPAGATVTIEPGVYLPDRFGVRIEDIIVLREGGHENLTASPKDLIVL